MRWSVYNAYKCQVILLTHDSNNNNNMVYHYTSKKKENMIGNWWNMNKDVTLENNTE